MARNLLEVEEEVEEVVAGAAAVVPGRLGGGVRDGWAVA